MVTLVMLIINASNSYKFSLRIHLSQADHQKVMIKIYVFCGNGGEKSKCGILAFDTKNPLMVFIS